MLSPPRLPMLPARLKLSPTQACATQAAAGPLLLRGACLPPCRPLLTSIGRLAMNQGCLWICAMVMRSSGSLTSMRLSRSRHSGLISMLVGMAHCRVREKPDRIDVGRVPLHLLLHAMPAIQLHVQCDAAIGMTAWHALTVRRVITQTPSTKKHVGQQFTPEPVTRPCFSRNPQPCRISP